MEKSLASTGMMPAGMFITPGAGADLDQHGNMKRGQITKILSALRSSRDATQNLRLDGKSRGRRRRELYFAVQGNSTLKPGVYKRAGDAGPKGGNPRGFVKVLNYTNDASYRPRLRLADVVGKAVHDNFADQFDQAFAYVVARKG